MPSRGFSPPGPGDATDSGVKDTMSGKKFTAAAAKVDRANMVARFIYVTLPQVRTIIGIAVMLHILWWWNHFTIIMIVGTQTGEYGYGSSTLPILSWYEAFKWDHLALGAAISVLAMVGIGGIIFWNARRSMRAA